MKKNGLVKDDACDRAKWQGMAKTITIQNPANTVDQGNTESTMRWQKCLTFWYKLKIIPTQNINCIILLLFESLHVASSVAKGGSSSPIGLKSMQNSTCLGFLMLIFAPKMKTAPPTGFGSRSCEGIAVIWTRIVEFFGSAAHPKSVKTFFVFLFLWTSPEFRWKNSLNFGEDLFFFLEITSFQLEKPFELQWRLFFFFLEITFRILTEKAPQSNSRLIKIWVKFVYGCIKLPKKPPPHFCKILGTRLHVAQTHKSWKGK